jgi:hypothetical protein
MGEGEEHAEGYRAASAILMEAYFDLAKKLYMENENGIHVSICEMQILLLFIFVNPESRFVRQSS